MWIDGDQRLFQQYIYAIANLVVLDAAWHAGQLERSQARAIGGGLGVTAVANADVSKFDGPGMEQQAFAIYALYNDYAVQEKAPDAEEVPWTA